MACSCSNWCLFQFGCTCGQFQNDKRDREAISAHEAFVARERLAEAARVAHPMPAPFAGWKSLCPACQHAAHEPMPGSGSIRICQHPNCVCTR